MGGEKDPSGTVRNHVLPAASRLFLYSFTYTLIVPFIAIAIEYLIITDPSVRTILAINLENFHIYQLFTSSFVHVNFGHFVGNVITYLLIAVYGLILATFLNRIGLYLALTKIVVIVFLLIGAGYTFFNLTTTYYTGLSGINVALAGSLLIFWVLFLGQVSGKGPGEFTGIALVLILGLSAGLIARYMQLYPATSAHLGYWSVTATILCVLAVLIYRDQVVLLCHILKKLPWPSLLAVLAIAGIYVFLVLDIFPARLANSTQGVSLSLHIAGVILGVLTGYLGVKYLDRIPWFKRFTPCALTPK